MSNLELKLWKDREKRQLDPRLFSNVAEEFAKTLSQDGRKSKRNKQTQIRKYFDEVVRLNEMAQTLSNSKEDKDIWENRILPQIHMLIAKVVYAKGRKLVTDSFINIIKDGINQIQDKEDLQIFTNFLEAFIGFYTFIHKAE